ncbi:calcium-binding protein [Xanthomonas fragariae]|uniref:calcium-binding protein n=1 Tax=Xanthomonas fragariae TaxID=48664 RepID=UPI000A35C8A8|nr:calcium-binding protein [Xanthomonas fragariae]SMQ95264.1 EF hand domain-containing protein [Xanthomonas fragariae]
MADTEQKKPDKISKLVYPFQKSAEAGKAGAKPTDIDDPQVYFDALSNAQDGFYPIGANGQWHGGIHFDTQTGNTLAQEDGIRCIGDGEVVAYQIDAKYPSIEYSAGKATYSRGFVLVRHRLELPPAPKQTAQPAPAGPDAANTAPSTPQPAAQPAATPDQKAQEPSLIFYSVYLHLLDWAGYQADPKKPRPAFWKSVAYVVGDKAKDRDRVSNPSIPEAGVGLNLRDAQHQKVGYAPRGAKLRLGAENPNKKGYFVISEVVSGQTVPADAKGLYAYKAELTAAGAEPDRQDAVYVPPTPAPIKAGDLIGYLGHYQRFADLKPLAATGPAQNGVRPLVQLDVFTAEDLKTFIAKSRERAKLLDAKQKTLLKIDVGAKLVLPSEPDQQIGAEEAAAVVAGGKDGAWVQVRKGTLQIMDKGSLSGFNSTTHTYGGGQILHRVLGASDSDSITEAAYNALKTKEEKDKYPRRQVLVPSGAPVWVQKALMGADTSVAGRSLKAWSTFPLQASQANGPEAGFIRVAAIKTLKKVATEPDGTRWWEVDVGKIDGSSGVGWAREKDHAKVTLCSPWDWPGFEYIEADGTTPEALYARHVVATKQAKPDEQAALEAKAQAATGGPLFSRVCDAIDLDDDRHLTREELQKALKQPWLAEAISRLVFHHTSEWGTPRAQWNAIDSDIPESRKADWDKEKNRIESLQWWSDVKTTPALPGDAKVYAFHPIGLIANFTGSSGCACGCCLGEIFASARYGKQYGPVYWGKLKLADFMGWDALITSGSVTATERDILVAMSENEGNMDAIQSYDSEVLTAGAMQKTVNPQGAGELPIQVYEFQQEHPALYQSLFADCGWEVKDEGGKKYLYYDGKTGSELKKILREGFDQAAFESKKKISSKPLATIANAIVTDEYKAKQVKDFVKRLRTANSLAPAGYATHKISDYIRSNLGKAVVLDHHVNRPGYVERDFGAALDTFFSRNPTVSRDPGTWATQHSSHESSILDIYGNSRVMTDASARYSSLKAKL